MQVRRVDVNGCISFRNQYLRIGKAFTHFPVGILLDATPGDQIQVYFGRFCVQSFDRSTLQKLLPVSQNDLLPISPVNTHRRGKLRLLRSVFTPSPHAARRHSGSRA